MDIRNNYGTTPLIALAEMEKGTTRGRIEVAKKLKAAGYVSLALRSVLSLTMAFMALLKHHASLRLSTINMTRLAMDQSIHQSINQSINQSIDQTTNLTDG